MRAGLAASIVGHAVILGFGFVALPDAEPFTPEKIEALPVELVTLAEETDLLTGDKTSEVLPEEKPQPKAEAEAEAPAPDPVEKPAEKPVETARAPAAKPEPPPEPEPEPEAEPEEVAESEPPPEPKPELEEVAALPVREPPIPVKPAEPLPEAEPEQPPEPVEARVPRSRPKPPTPPQERKQTAQQPKPEEKDRLRDLAETPAAEEEFKPADIAALLNKQEPAGGGDPIPAPEPQTLGSIDGKPEAAMTQSEIAALQARLYRCWNPPVGVREAGALVVEVQISLLPDGSLAMPPLVMGVSMASDPRAQVAVESAIRAVNECAPFGDILRPETYAEWRQINFSFDPRGMLGG